MESHNKLALVALASGIEMDRPRRVFIRKDPNEKKANSPRKKKRKSQKAARKRNRRK